MLEVFKQTYKELEEEEGMDTLWAKLRVVLKKMFAGQFLNEIELEEKNLLLKEKQMNGRQLCRLRKERFKGDRNQEIYKQQEVHHLKLVKDNIPGYPTALDALLLEVTMPEDTMCSLYTTQIQRKRTMQKYCGGLPLGAGRRDSRSVLRLPPWAS